MFIANAADTHAPDKARKQAQANANMSGKPWMVFRDANSNWHAELHRASQQGIEFILNPEAGTTPGRSTHEDSPIVQMARYTAAALKGRGKVEAARLLKDRPAGITLGQAKDTIDCLCGAGVMRRNTDSPMTYEWLLA